MSEAATAQREDILTPLSDTSSEATEKRGHPAERLPGESRLVDFIYEMVDSAESAMRSDGTFADLDSWLETYWGSPSAETGPSYRPSLHINELKTLILTEVSDLTDGRLRVYITRDPQHGKRDEDAEKGLQAVWDRARTNIHQVDATLWSFIAPCGYLTALWDPTLHVGQGDIIVASRHPWSVKVDPTATDDRQWHYVVLEDILALDQIDAFWPNRAGSVKPDAGLDLRYGAEQSGSIGGGPGGYYGPMAPRGGSISSSQPTRTVSRARVYSAFYRDDEMEDVPNKLYDDFNRLVGIKNVKRHKFPHGRLTQVAGDTVLYDGPNPYRFFPVVRVLTQPSPGRFYPSSTVGEFTALQAAAEGLDSNIIENAVRLNHGIVVTDTQSGINPGNFQGLPAQVVAIRRGSQLDIKYPPQMPADMIQQPERLRSIMRRVWGATDPRMGQGGKGNVSAELTETEIQQAQTLTRLRSRLIHDSVQRLAELMFSIMADFYRSPRAIPFVSGGRWDPVMWKPITADEATAYSVHVDASSIKPKSGMLLARLAPLLARTGVIDEEETLKALDWPDWKTVADRVAQKKQLAALMHAAGKQKKGK